MTQITSLQFPEYRALYQAIDENQSWLKILDVLRNDWRTEIYISTNPGDFETPAQKLLNEFDSRCWTLEHLLDILTRCELYHVVALFRTEPMRIIKEPDEEENIINNKLLIPIRDSLILEFKVYSIPQPIYTWYKDNKPLNDQTHWRLIYENFRPELQGKYYCVAAQTIGGIETFKESKVVIVEAIPELEIYRRPKPYINFIEGESIRLKILAAGFPCPEYEWTYENLRLNNYKNTYFIEKCKKSDTGLYRCKVYNRGYEETITIHVTVIDAALIQKLVSDPVPLKIAMLIGNKDYRNSHTLSTIATAEDDVKKLENVLNEKGFVVHKYFSCGLQEMNDALETLCYATKEGAYVLIYFSGHGFELRDKYLLPADVSDDFHLSDCLSENKILKYVLETKPKLFLLMLDMCLSLPDKNQDSAIFRETERVYDYKPDNNLLISYSTTSRLPSLVLGERNYYVEALIKNMRRNLPVLQIIIETNQNVEEECEKLKERLKRLEKIAEGTDKEEVQEKLRILNDRKQIPSTYNNITKGYDLNAIVIGNLSSQEYYLNITDNN